MMHAGLHPGRHHLQQPERRRSSGSTHWRGVRGEQ
jgi:hypothetical protein